MEQYSLIQNAWIILLLWSLVYLGDYYLTIYTAKGFRDRLSEHFEFERSFELNPVFEKDVNSLRTISPRHIALWLVTSILLYLLKRTTNLLNVPQLFYFIFGSLFLLEIAIHLRHLRNLAIIKSYAAGAIYGHMKHSYWFGLKLSAWELFGFSIVYGVFSLIGRSWFFFGGAVGCLIIAIKHNLGANKTKKLTRKTDPEILNA